MVDVWWAIIRRPNGAVHLYELGEAPYDVELARAKSQQGVVDDGPGWEVQVTAGEPHPELLWSRAEIKAARDQLEDSLGLPGQRAAVEALIGKLDEAAQVRSLPVDLLNRMYEDARKAQRQVRKVALSEVREALEGVPPSRATVHRRPVKQVPAAANP